MPECQFRVSCCFWFHKFYTENIIKIGGNLFLRTYNIGKLPEDQRPPRGEAPGAHTPWGRSLGWGRAQLGCGGPTWPPAPILHLYIPLDAKTLIKKEHIPQKVPSQPSSSISDRGSSDVLPGTLSEGKSSPGASTSSCLPPE